MFYKFNKTQSLILLSILIFMFSCSNKEKIESERIRLIEIDKKFAKMAQERGNKEAFIYFAAEDAVMLSHLQNPIFGKDEIGKSFDDSDGNLEWEPVYSDVSSSLDLGYTWGKYIYSYIDKNGTAKKSFGKYTSIWKKQTDGKWKWVVDIGNNSPSPSHFQSLEKFDPLRDAETDIKNAMLDARNMQKRIILDVGGEWCIWCKRLDRLISSNDELKKNLYDNFIVVKVNYSDENKNEKVLSKLPKIDNYPHFFVLDSNGDLLHSQSTTKFEVRQSYSLDKLLAFLNDWKIKN